MPKAKPGQKCCILCGEAVPETISTDSQWDYKAIGWVCPNCNKPPAQQSDIAAFITSYPAWDAYCREDADFLYLILLGTTRIHWDEIKQLSAYRAFSGIEIRDDFLCIRILKSEL